MDFMDLAKPGDIKHHCDPNALSTFLEYLLDYGSEETREVGQALIARKTAEMDDVRRAHTEKMLERVRSDERDVLC
jgi:2-iminoacetate synthase